MSLADTISRTILDYLYIVDGTPLVATAPKFILANRAAPRPAMPYLTVKVVPGGTTTAHDEQRNGVSVAAGTPPTRKVYGRRVASVSVQGYGPGSIDLINAAVDNLIADTPRAVLTAGGLTLRKVSDPVDLSALIGTGQEERYSVDLAADYATETDPATGIELLVVEVATTYQRFESDPAAFVITHDVDL